MKFVLTVLLAVSAAVAAKQVCTPYSQFNDYCNKCVCAEDGLSLKCTEMMCDKKIWNPDGTVKVLSKFNKRMNSITKSVEKICEPASQFKNYCNTCVCADDGSSFICTRMMCDENLWNKDGSLKEIPNSHRVTRSAKQVCTPRSQFKDYCNTCTCSKDGMSFGCTRRLMCDKNILNQGGSLKVIPNSNRIIRSAQKQICKPRSQFNDYCNICDCSEDGLSFRCTRMMCDKKIWNPDGTVKDSAKFNRITRSAVEKVCEPGSHFKNYCNTCGCADDGLSFICTRMMCDEKIWNSDGTMKIVPDSHRMTRSAKQVCKRGTYFKKSCNTCHCSDDGLFYGCTRINCDEEIRKPNRIMKNWFIDTIATGSADKNVCKPGSVFNRYCNLCTCSDDGKSFSCTRMECDLAIWNEDGTMKFDNESKKR